MLRVVLAVPPRLPRLLGVGRRRRRAGAAAVQAAVRLGLRWHCRGAAHGWQRSSMLLLLLRVGAAAERLLIEQEGQVLVGGRRRARPAGGAPRRAHSRAVPARPAHPTHHRPRLHTRSRRAP